MRKRILLIVLFFTLSISTRGGVISMANKYCNLQGSQKISESYININTGFDAVEADINALDSRVNTIITTPIDGEAAAQELVDARGGMPTLGARLNIQLPDMRILKNGLIKLPSDFPALPFQVSKISKGVYKHNATPYNQFDWSDAIEVFISSYNTTDSPGYTQPISLNKFLTNLDSGVYGSHNKFILTFLDNLYLYGAGAYYIAENKNINILFRSGSPSGFTWVARVQRPGIETSGWVADSGVYKTTQLTDYNVIDVIDFVNVDNYGMPLPYRKVGSLAECQAQKGTFYKSGADVWCNPYDENDIKNILLQVSSTMFYITESNPVKIMFENIGFVTNTYSFNPTNVNTEFWFFNCRFYRGFNDAFAITGAYKAYLLDCVAAYGSKDGFNYHTTNSNSLAVEVNCISYGNGKYKLPGGNATTHSNNGSTAHDGMRICRIGCKYWDCEGPIVADVNNCYSISIGCSAIGILETCTGIKAAFYFDNASASEPYKNKYVIECEGSGAYMEYGIKGTNETYYMNFEGLKVFDGGIQTIDWEAVING